ncbi:MAG: NAD(P)-binding domain-containing protein [Pseudomonadota bacterium]
MKIGVLGTGMVGKALATKLAAMGHDVMMGARSRGNEAAEAWAAEANASAGSFTDAAAHGDIVLMATLGSATVEAAQAAGTDALNGKVVIDVTNPLDMSQGFPPTLLDNMQNKSSLGEALQAAMPGAHVVKALNTMNCSLMVDPSRIEGDHDVFLCGNDSTAKATAIDLLKSFGWAAPVDLGPIEASRGLEGLMNFWLRMYGVVGHANFNYKVVIGEQN